MKAVFSILILYLLSMFLKFVRLLLSRMLLMTILLMTTMKVDSYMVHSTFSYVTYVVGHISVNASSRQFSQFSSTFTPPSRPPPPFSVVPCKCSGPP